MLRKRYTLEKILQHLLMVEPDTGKGLAMLNASMGQKFQAPTFRLS